MGFSKGFTIEILMRMRSRIGRIRRRFRMFRHQGYSWPAIGRIFDRSAGWAHRVTNDKTYPFSKESLSHIEERLPPLLWETNKDLDALVIHHLQKRGRTTGAKLGEFCGAGERTIRSSIKRLRKAGHNIGASMTPPRGYYLEER